MALSNVSEEGLANYVHASLYRFSLKAVHDVTRLFNNGARALAPDPQSFSLSYDSTDEVETSQ